MHLPFVTREVQTEGREVADKSGNKVLGSSTKVQPIPFYSSCKRGARADLDTIDSPNRYKISIPLERCLEHVEGPMMLAKKLQFYLFVSLPTSKKAR